MAGVYRDTCAVTSALTASTTATNSTAVRDVQVATHTHTHTPFYACRELSLCTGVFTQSVRLTGANKASQQWYLYHRSHWTPVLMLMLVDWWWWWWWASIGLLSVVLICPATHVHTIRHVRSCSVLCILVHIVNGRGTCSRQCGHMISLAAAFCTVLNGQRHTDR